MAYGEIYKTTWWGDGIPNSIYWGSVYSDLASTFNRYAVRFDGLTPSESISTSTDFGYDITESEGIVIMAWVKLNNDLLNSTYDQKCIVDYSSNINSTANGKGYSLYVRRSSTIFSLNWFYKRTGLTKSQCEVTIDISSLVDLNKPMLIMASLQPNGTNNSQFMRLWQEGAGISGIGYKDSVSKLVSISGTTFPSTQNVCFGNTNASGTLSSEFIGDIDEVAVYSGDLQGNHIQLSSEYFSGKDDEYYLDLSNLSYYNNIVGWYRFGDPEIIETSNGDLFFENESNGVGTAAISTDLDISDVVRQIIN